MMIKRLALIVFCLGTMACSQSTHFMKMEETLNGYGAAIRWGLWEKAADFQVPQKRSRLDLGHLKTIHVTGYDPVYRQEHSGSDVILQTVEIQYYLEDTGLVKNLTDHQTWQYDKEKGQWLLQSRLPSFKP